jgi:hypothetical protein
VAAAIVWKDLNAGLLSVGGRGLGDQTVGIDQGGLAALLVEGGPKAPEQPARDLGHVVDSPHVQRDELQVVRGQRELAHDRLRSGEEEVAVQLIDPCRAAVRLEHAPVFLGALQRGRRLEDVVVGHRAKPGPRSDTRADATRPARGRDRAVWARPG